MKSIKLKKEFENFEAGFNGKHGELGERNDLAKFLIIAYQANRQDYLDMFEEKPTLEELLKDQAAAALKDNPVFTTHPGHLPAGVSPMPLGPATDQARALTSEPETTGTPAAVAAGTEGSTAGPAVVTGLAGRGKAGHPVSEDTKA